MENLDEYLKNRNLQFNDDLVYSKNCPKEVKTIYQKMEFKN